MVLFPSAGIPLVDGEKMNLALFVDKVATPVTRFGALCDRVEESVGSAIRRRVDTIDRGWFDRLVERPVVGRICDFVVNPGEAAVFVQLLALVSLVMGGLMAWMMPFLYFWIGTYTGEVTTVSVVTMLVCALAWFVPYFAALWLCLHVYTGVIKGFGMWKVRYRVAQQDHWKRRHPGESIDYCSGEWRYTRD